MSPPNSLPAFRFGIRFPTSNKRYSMRAETEAVVDDIKQAISLLRRHL